MLAVVIDRQVSGDLEQPGLHLSIRGSRNRCPAHPDEDVLGQVTGRLCFPDRPAEVLEQAMLVDGEECCWVVGHASLPTRTWEEADPLNGGRSARRCACASPMGPGARRDR